MEKIRVIIVDDHELVRLSLRTAIECRHIDIVFVGEADSGIAFFDLLETVAADIVLLDIIMPDMSGIEIARRLKTEHSDIKILAVSSDNSLSTIEEMLQIGIEGFVSKSNCKPDILAEPYALSCRDLSISGKIFPKLSAVFISPKKEPRT